MPLKMCGSVSARFSVWFSRRSAAANVVDVCCPAPRGRRGRARRARRVPAHDVQRRPALASRPRSGAACPRRSRGPAGPPCRAPAAPAAFQRNRPAIIRCTTRKRSPSSAEHDALAEPLESDRPGGPRQLPAAARRIAAGTVPPAGSVRSGGRRSRAERVKIQLDVGQLGHLGAGAIVVASAPAGVVLGRGGVLRRDGECSAKRGALTVPRRSACGSQRMKVVVAAVLDRPVASSTARTEKT